MKMCVHGGCRETCAFYVREKLSPAGVEGVSYRRLTRRSEESIPGMCLQRLVELVE